MVRLELGLCRVEDSNYLSWSAQYTPLSTGKISLRKGLLPNLKGAAVEHYQSLCTDLFTRTIMPRESPAAFVSSVIISRVHLLIS